MSVEIKNYPFSLKLKMSYMKAYKEINITLPRHLVGQAKDYAIYPKIFYKNIDLNQNKIYDFIFIGSFLCLYTPKKEETTSTRKMRRGEEAFLNRKWIIPFIEEKFNDNSYLQFTDKQTKKHIERMGNYDYSHIKEGYVPRLRGERRGHKPNYFDKEYFNNLSKSKFCLCPAGEFMWSMRFYEALMCKCIPIVDKIDETFRNEAESKLDYKYYLTSSSEFVYREDWVEHNYKIFIQYHTLHHLTEDI